MSSNNYWWTNSSSEDSGTSSDPYDGLVPTQITTKKKDLITQIINYRKNAIQQTTSSKYLTLSTIKYQIEQSKNIIKDYYKKTITPISLSSTDKTLTRLLNIAEKETKSLYLQLSSSNHAMCDVTKTPSTVHIVRDRFVTPLFNTRFEFSPFKIEVIRLFDKQAELMRTSDISAIEALGAIQDTLLSYKNGQSTFGKVTGLASELDDKDTYLLDETISAIAIVNEDIEANNDTYIEALNEYKQNKEALYTIDGVKAEIPDVMKDYVTCTNQLLSIRGQLPLDPDRTKFGDYKSAMKQAIQIFQASGCEDESSIEDVSLKYAVDKTDDHFDKAIAQDEE